MLRRSRRRTRDVGGAYVVSIPIVCVRLAVVKTVPNRILVIVEAIEQRLRLGCAGGSCTDDASRDLANAKSKVGAETTAGPRVDPGPAAAGARWRGRNR